MRIAITWIIARARIIAIGIVVVTRIIVVARVARIVLAWIAAVRIGVAWIVSGPLRDGLIGSDKLPR